MAAPGDIGVYGYGVIPGQLANREDLLDLITNVDPWDTPWVTQAPKVRAMHVTHEWLTDTLAATSTAGAIEGNDWEMSNYTTTRPARFSNWTQIFRKDIAASETQRAVNPAGFKDAYAYEIAKATKEIARNIEATVFQSLVSTSGAASGTSAAARAMIGFQGWLSASAVSANTSATNGISSAPVTELDLNNALQKCYTNGGNPEQCYVSPAAKRQISNFTSTTASRRNIAILEKQLVAALDLYDSDFGLLQIVLDRWVPQATNVASAGNSSTDQRGNIFFLERSKNRLAWLRPVMHTLVGKSGDSVRGSVIGEVTLEVLNTKADYRVGSVNNSSSVSS